MKVYIAYKLELLTSNGVTIDSLLASYFLTNLTDLPKISFSDCMVATNVSKASLNRFYKKAGFTNYKNFVNELYHEHLASIEALSWEYRRFPNENIMTSFTQEPNAMIISTFLNDLEDCNQVIFYGDGNQIGQLSSFRSILHIKGIKTTALYSWDKQANIDQVCDIEENDLMVVIDLNYELPFLIERSIQQKDAINLDWINSITAKKYFFGKAKHHTYKNFKTVSLVSHQEKAINRHILVALDEILTKSLRGQL